MNSAPRSLSIVGIPWDRESSFLQGAAMAPPRIREALFSPSSNLWTESGTDLASCLRDAGDLSLPGAEAASAIEKGMSAILSEGAPFIALGGDHSITYPVLRALRKSHRRLAILQCDAHPDLYDAFEGNRLSHASPFARVMEEKLADRLVQVGVRTLNEHQRRQAERFSVEILEMRDWQRHREIEFDTPLYLSVDLDVLDPAFAPGVSHYEPGGCTTRQLIDLIQSLRAPVVGADIVEYNPVRDPQGTTAMTAAKLLKEIAGKMLERGGD